MKRIRVVLGLVVAVALWVGVTGCSETHRDGKKLYRFSMNYPAGKYVLATATETEQTLFVGEEQVHQTVKMGLCANMAVKPHSPSDDFTVELRPVDWYQNHVQDGKMLLDYDSADPAKASAEPLATILGGLGKQRYAIEFNHQGEIRRARGPRAYWDKLAKNPDLAGHLIELRAQFGVKIFAGSFDVCRVAIPRRPVVVGEVWQANPNGGPGAIKGKATLKSVTPTPEGDLAEIHLVGVLGDVTKAPGLTLVDSRMKFSIAVTVYVETGVMKTCIMKTDSTMNIVTPNGSVPIKAQSTITTTLKKQ